MTKTRDIEPVEHFEIKGGPEALLPYVGKVVALDDEGVVREWAETWDALLLKLSDDALHTLSLLYIPPHRVVG